MKNILRISVLSIIILACSKKEAPILSGSIEFNLDWYELNIQQKFIVGLGYSSADIVANAFFYSETLNIIYPTNRPPIKISKNNLIPGIYYYKITKPEIVYSQNGVVYHIHAFEKSGAITVTSNQTAFVSVYINGGSNHPQ